MRGLDESFRFNEQALRLRSERQQVLASNIANADTPNYKARDIDFASSLKAALTQGGLGKCDSQLTLTAPDHLSSPDVAPASGSAVLYRMPRQGSVDGNTVDMDVERNDFLDNSVRYEAGISAVNAQIKAMLAAIQG